MAVERVLVVVKTYPTLSEKYDELVCTAGFLENGKWIRIYPVPFRKLAPYEQYEKYQWIEVDLTKNPKDERPESYRPIGEIKVLEKVGTGKKRDWLERKKLVLGEVYTDMSKILEDCKTTGKSLAVLKATITGFKIRPCERDWDPLKLAKIKANQNQLDLFEEREVFEVVHKIPYEFSYEFTTDDGIKRTLMIEDWELGSLYWKYKDSGEEVACDMVKQKYFDYMVGERDLYLFLGTTAKWQKLNAPNPFIVIGTFYPPKQDVEQLSLF